MNDQERKYFDALTRDRSESAHILEKRSMSGIKDSVVEKYSDQAHFIYELLQNADDAHATSARFVLKSDHLIFAHDGTRYFSVSNPDTEDEDSARGKLGDVNSITSIANSNKLATSIGKFGVGFKAIFQYTQTPRIYDPKFRFQIERFIVPIQLGEDFPDRRPKETLFVFPFDHPDRCAEEAYEDISYKLRSLTFPLLFLSGLSRIEYEIDGKKGAYEKSILETHHLLGVTGERICLKHCYVAEEKTEIRDELWLFSNTDGDGRRCSVGFSLDEEGRLRPIHKSAFCFFPTKEDTGLNFIIHAPFLLTDSREGIKADDHNRVMVRRLAELSAKALLCLRNIGERKSIRLIDDKILRIIPYDRTKFGDPNSRERISFRPFYEAILEVFQKEKIIPAREGYVSSSNAYWASTYQLTELFSNEQLAEICENKSARWVFCTYGRDTHKQDRALLEYVDSIVRTNINESSIINGRSFNDPVRGIPRPIQKVKGIDSDFIENQKNNVEWLHRFYKWLSETKSRRDAILKKPIFLDQDQHAVAAFDDKKQPILFLPVDGIEGYKVVHHSLLEHPETKRFIIDVGIKEPTLKDYIYNVVLQRYEKGEDRDLIALFKLSFSYYCGCSIQEAREFVENLKKYDFLRCYKPGVNGVFRNAASALFFPTPDLLTYFKFNQQVQFVKHDEYVELVGPEKVKILDTFLVALGVKKAPTIISKSDDPYSCNRREREDFIEGLCEFIKAVEKTQDANLSFFLWRQLCQFSTQGMFTYGVLHKTIETLPKRGRKWVTSGVIESSTVDSLKTCRWLVDSNGVFVSVKEVTKKTLSREYDFTLSGAHQVLAMLEIGESTNNNGDVDDHLTEEERKKIKLANKLIAAGIDEEILDEIIQRINGTGGDGETPGGTSDPKPGEPTSSGKKTVPKAPTDYVIEDIANIIKGEGLSGDDSPYYDAPEEDFDFDEYTPRPVDYAKRIERAKQRSAVEISQISRIDRLQQQALEKGVYTFGWFKALLELESLSRGETSYNSKEVSISFAKVEREPGTKRTLILKQPNRYIPQFIEDLADFPLVLHMGESTKTVVIEVANVISYTLRVKLKSDSDIDDIDFSTIESVSIDAKSPEFLLSELKSGFVELGYDDDFDMKANLCANIEFVFGPPGTGKTTYLARNVLMPLIAKNSACKILVLTPTNKAADVLVRRIMEVSGSDRSYENWLVRFGATGDERIEESPVFKDKSFDIQAHAKNVTVTTIARFPYDYYMTPGKRLLLNELNWDYIVIDEASMIPLANIVYPLYKKTPKKFIIAGDPFQIEPITSVDLWRNKNIYEMVGLKDFAYPKTEPRQYEVTPLTTQYRSIPEIGDVFSKFAYRGELKHERSSSGRRPLNLKNGLRVMPLNIIKFPVSKYESIYRAKKLQGSSSYQIYSALFTYEYVIRLAQAIAEANPGSRFKIGVIAPYRAQADLIDKLVSSEKTPKEIEVQVGTIHGFQGDECDIVFAVFNPPPTISGSPEMFLNKPNIINVSISRARDYLFIVMPDDNTERISALKLVKKVERLIKSSRAFVESSTVDLERFLFGRSDYLESNTFSTGHQSVNVYGLPETCYEVRTEDNAVDIQVHRGVRKVVSEAPARRENHDSTLDDRRISYEREISSSGAENAQRVDTRQERVERGIESSRENDPVALDTDGERREENAQRVDTRQDRVERGIEPRRENNPVAMDTDGERREENAQRVDIRQERVERGVESKRKDKPVILDVVDVDEFDFEDDEDFERLMIESLIPQKLRKNAISIHATGVVNGLFYLVPYDGRTRDYTNHRLVEMRVRMDNKNEIAVSLDKEDRLIYMKTMFFTRYRSFLTKAETIELRSGKMFEL